MTTSSQPQVTNERILLELKDWHREVLARFEEIKRLTARVERLEQSAFGREVTRR